MKISPLIITARRRRRLAVRGVASRGGRGVGAEARQRRAAGLLLPHRGGARMMRRASRLVPCAMAMITSSTAARCSIWGGQYPGAGGDGPHRWRGGEGNIRLHGTGRDAGVSYGKAEEEIGWTGRPAQGGELQRITSLPLPLGRGKVQIRSAGAGWRAHQHRHLLGGHRHGSRRCPGPCAATPAIWWPDQRVQSVQFRLTDIATRAHRRRPGCWCARRPPADEGRPDKSAWCAVAERLPLTYRPRVCDEALQLFRRLWLYPRPPEERS